MRNRYRLESAETADTVSRRLDRLVAERLPSVLDGQLGEFQRRLGLSEDSLIAIRRLNVRLHLPESIELDDSRLIDSIATSWGEGVLDGLDRILTHSGYAAGRTLITDTLAVFPDRQTACEQHLVHMVRHEFTAAPWWSKPLLGSLSYPAALPELLIEMVAGSWRRTSALMIASTRESGTHWLTRLSDTDCRRLLAALRQATMHLPPDVAADQAEDDLFAATLGHDLPQLPSVSRPGVAALWLGVRLLAAGRSIPDDPSDLARMLADWPRHTVDDDAGELPGADVLRTQAAAPDTDANESPGSDPREPEEDRGGSPPVEGDRLVSPLEPDTGTEDDATDERAEFGRGVGCGGLLFLIRFALQRWERGLDVPVDEAMLALGCRTLTPAFKRLPAASRRAAWRRDAPLLQVFSGRREAIDNAEALELGPAALDWAETVHEALSQAVRNDVRPGPNACRYVLGADDAVLTPLESLLLRPGRLLLTDTEARLRLTADCVDLAIRRGGWDIDPGWVPRLGRIIRFEYRD